MARRRPRRRSSAAARSRDLSRHDRTGRNCSTHDRRAARRAACGGSPAAGGAVADRQGRRLRRAPAQDKPRVSPPQRRRCHRHVHRRRAGGRRRRRRRARGPAPTPTPTPAPGTLPSRTGVDLDRVARHARPTPSCGRARSSSTPPTSARTTTTSRSATARHGARQRVREPGGERHVRLTLAPAAYTLYCSLPTTSCRACGPTSRPLSAAVEPLAHRT